MSPTLATFLFELVNFLLLAGVLGWLLFKPVRAMLQARQAAGQKQADDLAARAAAADRLQAEWQQRHASFETDMAQARSARLVAAEEEAAAIVAKAREAADRERRRAAATLVHVERAQLEHFAVLIAATAREAVERLLTALDSPDLEASFVRAACHRLQALDARPLGAVLVESATPLGDSDHAALRTAVGTRASSVVFQVAPDLGSGVRVTTARGLIDATAAAVAAEAERRLKKGLVTDALPAVKT